MYRISSDLGRNHLSLRRDSPTWSLHKIFFNTASQACNGLTGIRHFGTIETPGRTLVHFQHLACISNIMVNAPTYRIFLLWSLAKCGLLHTEVLFNANQFVKFPVILASHSYVRCRISTRFSCWLRDERFEHCCVFLE